MRPHVLSVGSTATIIALVVAGCGSPVLSPAPTANGPSGRPSATGTPTVSIALGEPSFSDVPFYRDDVLGHLIEPGPGPSGTPELAWNAGIGTTHWAPILVDGLLVAGNTAGTIVALDARTGAERWRFQAANPVGTAGLNSSAAAADGLVFVSDARALYALDATSGVERWTVRVPTRGSRPLVVDGVVYVGSVGSVVGFDAARGDEVWRWRGPPDVAFLMGAVADGVAYVSSRGDGRLYAVDIHDALELWHVQTISLTVGSPEVFGATVYVGTNQGEATDPVGELYAIDRASGTIRWRFRGPSGVQLVPGPVQGGIVFVSTEEDGMYALRDDGSVATQVWHVDAPPSLYPLSMVGDTLYEQRDDASIGAYAASDGSLLWQTPALPDDTGGGPPLVSGGMVFEVADAHGVAAFADPTLIAVLPPPAPAATPSPTPASQLPDPFTVVRSFSWAATGLAIPLGMDVGRDGLLYILDTKPSVTVVDPRDGRVVRTWGRQGAGPGEFDLTRLDDNPGYGDVAVAPNGQVYVADGSNHRVQIFGPDGTYISQFGSFGTGEGQFGSISEIAIGHDGRAYVLDESANQLSAFTRDGKFLWRSPLAGADPDLAAYLHGVTVRPDGTVLLDCENCGHILVLDPTDGHVRERLPVAPDAFGPLELDRAGSMYVAVFDPQAEIVLDGTGRLLGGLYYRPGMTRLSIGRNVTWGDVFWPSPVFLPDGMGYSFGKQGLLELKVSLPAR